MAAAGGRVWAVGSGDEGREGECEGEGGDGVRDVLGWVVFSDLVPVSY